MKWTNTFIEKPAKLTQEEIGWVTCYSNYFPVYINIKSCCTPISIIFQFVLLIKRGKTR